MGTTKIKFQMDYKHLEMEKSFVETQYGIQEWKKDYIQSESYLTDKDNNEKLKKCVNFVESWIFSQ